MFVRLRTGLTPFALACFGAMATAQAAPLVVDDEMLEERITAACAALHEKRQLVPCSRLVEEASVVRQCAMPAVALRQTALPPADLHDLVLPSVRIVGHYYLCKECDAWHFSGASGFCVTTDGAVATCAHVLSADETMREAFLVVADLHGQVWPVERVLAADAKADVCVVATAQRGCVPLPLRAAVRTGERVYCLSHPDHSFGFFSEGLVARQYVLREPLPDGAPKRPLVGEPTWPWLHVTCDFAKGSSGAPLVDACGNVLGIAQSTTTLVYDDAAEVVDTQMVFKTATPAARLQALAAPPTAGAEPARQTGGRQP